MKICLTGGAGFIGSHVAEAYLGLGHEVVVVDDLSTGSEKNVPSGAKFVRLDIRDREAVDRLFEAERFEVVNHHAAQVSVPAGVADPRHDASVNVTGLLNVLEASRRTGVSKFIFISSGGTVYGEVEELPISEARPVDPCSPYGITKAAGEFYVRFFGRQYGLRWTSLRYSNVYGPRQDPHGEAGVVAIFSQRLAAGRPVKIYGLAKPGDGGCFRDYVYVGDVAQANMAALERGDGEALNIGTGKQSRTREIFDTLCSVAGKTVPVEDAPPRPGDVPRNAVDPAKARDVLKWEPRTTLAEGLARTFEFFRTKTEEGSL